MSRVDGYADALAAVLRAEDASDASDEIYRFAQAYEANEALRGRLTDKYIPAATRQQVVEDILGPRAHPVTSALVSMIVGAGRAGDLPEIARSLVAKNAAISGREVAEVRTAVELSAEQRDRLAASLKKATGKDVELKVTIDPSVLGGVITQIGDTVIDGSVRSRLAQVRAHLG